MIIEGVFSLLLFIPELLLSLLPTITIELPDNVLSGANSLFGAIGYIFPVAALLPIVVMSIALDSFRIIVAIVIRIKSFIPTMGS
jgi:hypothetical protein